MADQELNLRSKIEGADETAAKIDNIADAQDRVARTTDEGAKSAEKKTAAQDKLNASESDYVELLRQISPALGNFVDAAIKGSKVAGDLASQNINLAGAGSKALDVIKNNAGALKLLLAGGAVAAGLFAISRAFAAIKEEAAAAEKAIKEQTAALNELEGRRRDRASEIERVSDTRAGGGLTADQSRAATSFAQRLSAKFGGAVDDAIINDVVGKLFGRGFTEQQIEEAVLARQVDPSFTVDPRERADRFQSRLSSTVGRNRAAIERLRSREATQRTESAQAAQTQALGTGPDIDLRNAAKALFPELTDEGVGRLVNLARGLGTERGLEESLALGRKRLQAIGGNRNLVLPDEGLFGNGTVGVTDVDINQLRQLLHEISRSSSVTVIDNRNARFVGPDEPSRRARVRGGGNIDDVRRNEVR